jgi:hypothetical protein
MLGHVLFNVSTMKHIHVVTWLCTTFREIIKDDIRVRNALIHKEDIEYACGNVERYMTEFFNSFV